MIYYIISFTRIGAPIINEQNAERIDGYETENGFTLMTKDRFEVGEDFVTDPERVKNVKILAEFTAKELLELHEDLKWLIGDISSGIIEESKEIRDQASETITSGHSACPNCGKPMTLGASHAGPGLQRECHHCGFVELK